MKKTIFFLFFLCALSWNRGNAQIALEHVYDSSSVHLYMVHLEVDGDKYVWRDLWLNRRIVLYNLDHSLFKEMPLPPNVHMHNNQMGLLYVSQHLFNTDNTIEYMLAYLDSFTYIYTTKIIDEAGNIIFSVDSLFPAVLANVPQSQVPIYNTTDGTKMILSEMYSANIRAAHVFSLGGTLSTSIRPVTYEDELLQLTAYPNPNDGRVQLDYVLPPGIESADLILYNISGSEVKRFKVDRNFSNILLDTTELPAGTYFYQLVTVYGASEAKKMLLISH